MPQVIGARAFLWRLRFLTIGAEVAINVPTRSDFERIAESYSSLKEEKEAVEGEGMWCTDFERWEKYLELLTAVDKFESGDEASRGYRQ